MTSFKGLIEHLEERVAKQGREAEKYRMYSEAREKEARDYRRQERFHRNEAEAAAAALAELRAKDQRIRLYGVDPITEGGAA